MQGYKNTLLQPRERDRQHSYQEVLKCIQLELEHSSQKMLPLTATTRIVIGELLIDVLYRQYLMLLAATLGPMVDQTPLAAIETNKQQELEQVC